MLVWLTDARTAVKAALGLSMFIPPAPMTLWYVAMIVVCYALAPLLVVPKVIRALTYGTVAWVFMLVYGLVVEMDYRMLTQFAAFAGGVLCRRLGWREQWRDRPAWLAAGFAVAFLAAVMSLKQPLLGAVMAVPQGNRMNANVVNRWNSCSRSMSCNGANGMVAPTRKGI